MLTTSFTLPQAFDYIIQSLNSLRTSAGNFPPGGSREYLPILPEDMASNVPRTASIGWDESTYETGKPERKPQWDSAVYATNDKGASPKKTATLQNPWDKGIYETGVDQAAAGWNATVYDTGSKQNTLYDSAQPKTITLRRDGDAAEYSQITATGPASHTYEVGVDHSSVYESRGERLVSAPGSNMFVVPTEDDA